MKPTDVVLPLLAIDSNGKVDDFLGSGFFAGESSLFVTAMHNTEGAEENLGVVHIDDLEHTFPASVLLTDRDSDIAILNIPDYRPKTHLTIERNNNLPSNLSVICFEYGTTVKQGNLCPPDLGFAKLLYGIDISILKITSKRIST